MTAGARVDRARITRTLTFWLRPAFVLRVLNRFQRVAGFDRAIALASTALTALIPLAIVAGALLSRGDGKDAAHRIIARFDLTGKGAQAVQDVLSPAGGTSTEVSILGAFLLIVAVLSFSRGVQRLFEQTWELKPLSVRNTLNDLLWIAGLVAFVAFSWWVHELIGRGKVQVAAELVLILPTAVFMGWSGRVLSARRIGWREAAPFAVLGAVLFAGYLIGASVYLPHLFSVYASRYGAIGAVLAMISALFGAMLVLVAAAAAGREVAFELERIGRGERPPDDEVKREWDAVIEQARSRWEAARGAAGRLRRRRRDGRG
jgi:membrane protein